MRKLSATAEDPAADWAQVEGAAADPRLAAETHRKAREDLDRAVVVNPLLQPAARALLAGLQG